MIFDVCQVTNFTVGSGWGWGPRNVRCDTRKIVVKRMEVSLVLAVTPWVSPGDFDVRL